MIKLTFARVLPSRRMKDYRLQHLFGKIVVVEGRGMVRSIRYEIDSHGIVNEDYELLHD